MIAILQNEGSEPSRRKQGKRLLANEDTCKKELKNDCLLLLSAYNEAKDKTNQALALFPLKSRGRALEANIMQSFFNEALFNYFSEKVSFGKYKRLILRIKGYLILFKKLDKKGYPMNIKTYNVQSILNQNQALDLYAETNYNDLPILYFGYQKNKIGEYVNPQIVYIDEGEITFTIDESNMQLEIPFNNQENVNNDIQVEVKPKIKGQDFRKAN